ncbi:MULTISPECIES: (2Fe-2S) ferredoxin domain-containing protein [Cyanophyceae]|uniref:(2Fe-2S) ferredoxin domain-containing protein n=1 Tax=Cyanophyceae TaxID=3028117 RepID=UPI0015E8C22D|nr:MULTISPECIES: (2Fe-2S) ferredoxin domain-containing protein [Cyanophyceae]
MTRTVLICCHHTCPKQGSTAILAAFQAQAPADVEVRQTGCFGECGNGPLVRVLPDEVWYAHVQQADIPAIVKQHLRQNRPVKQKLYGKFHQPNHGAIAALFLFFSFFGFLIGLCWLLASHTEVF